VKRPTIFAPAKTQLAQSSVDLQGCYRNLEHSGSEAMVRNVDTATVATSDGSQMPASSASYQLAGDPSRRRTKEALVSVAEA
jgi:hypothetical protein